MNMPPILRGPTACLISLSPESEHSRVGTERWCVSSRPGVDPGDDSVRQLSIRSGFAGKSKELVIDKSHQVQAFPWRQNAEARRASLVATAMASMLEPHTFLPCVEKMATR